LTVAGERERTAPGDRELALAVARACLLALLFLVVLWAFVSYLRPSFSGERVGEILICN
jgi:hypothetical protein